MSESNSNVLIDSVIKFDKVMMMTIRILETKINLTRSISNLQKALTNLKTQKAEIYETFYNILHIGQSDKEELEETTFERESSISLFALSKIFITFVLLY